MPISTLAQPGLKANWRQFSLLVLINAFVGGMVGMERSIFPQFAASQFQVNSQTALLSFIIAFGITKAVTNYVTGRLADRYGRRRLLIWGWVIALPVPFMLIYAPAWSWVVLANVLLGMSQGLTWSSTVVMKIDLAGPKQRGLAMGLNESAGYGAVGLVALLTGYIAAHYGIVPYPFYLGIGISLTGLLLSLFWVKDTRSFVHRELENSDKVPPRPPASVFLETSFRNKNLSAITQAGMVNNLNDGMVWGILPVLLLQWQYNQEQIGMVTAAYPAIWGLGQLFTGSLSDHYPHKPLLFVGMLLQALIILCIPFFPAFSLQLGLALLLGLGTALVYPTFLSAIASGSHPAQRAESIGTFRLWRDLGYAIGALLSGITADLLGIRAAIMLIGFITLASALAIAIRMPSVCKPHKADIN